MRSWTAALLAGLFACQPEPLCGEDEDGEAIPSCLYEIDGVEHEFCPLDHWSDSECRSCGCTGDSDVICSEPQCAAGS